jgi:hypothetical protein
MVRIDSLSRTGLALTALGMLTGVLLVGGPANAIVYCNAAGVPAGCVAHSVAPVARAVIPGVGAPGVGVRAGVPMNRGGPVNRVGRR